MMLVLADGPLVCEYCGNHPCKKPMGQPCVDIMARLDGKWTRVRKDDPLWKLLRTQIKKVKDESPNNFFVFNRIPVVRFVKIMMKARDQSPDLGKITVLQCGEDLRIEWWNKDGLFHRRTINNIR